ncbi:MAG: YitT family protein [Bacteroidales bacterium]|nr:YitT family protein [Bacteroidales bacterium]
MAFIVRYDPFSRPWFKAYALIVVGALFIASGYAFFITPHKIVPGGIYGISIVLHHTFGTPVGMMALTFNLPLTLVGIKVLGPRFGIKTFTGFMLTSLFMDLISLWVGDMALIPDDLILSSVYGGAVIGLGVGFLFKAKATCGGTDVMAMMLGKWTGRPLGQLMMTVDTIIVIMGSLVFLDWKIPMYSIITIFVMGKTIDTVLQGWTHDKVALIISNRYEEISNAITDDIQRSSTLIHANGMFAGAERNILYVVLNRNEIPVLEQRVHQADPTAFVAIINADEILGEGFKSLRDKVCDS